MNTKHFFSLALLFAVLLFTTFQADAQRRHRGYDRYNRYQPRYRPIVRPHVVVAPVPVPVCLPPTRQGRYVRRHIPCTPPVCYAPPRRHMYRWHR